MGSVISSGAPSFGLVFANQIAPESRDLLIRWGHQLRFSPVALHAADVREIILHAVRRSVFPTKCIPQISASIITLPDK
jgi:hypothetical protein